MAGFDEGWMDREADTKLIRPIISRLNWGGWKNEHNYHLIRDIIVNNKLCNINKP